jgi:hypothetical protein
VKIEIETPTDPDTYNDVVIDGALAGYVTGGSNGEWYWISPAQVSLADPIDGRDNIRGTGYATPLAAVEAILSQDRTHLWSTLLAATVGCGYDPTDRQLVIDDLLGADHSRVWSGHAVEAAVEAAHRRLAG